MRAARAALAAVAFLTRVPAGRVVALTEADVAAAAPLFPLVGAGVGALVAGVALLLEPPLSPFLAAAVAVAAGVAVTGAFHLDGLADTFDATGGSTRERALEIMRDSRIGTYGAAALALDLIVRVGAVGQLLSGGGLVGAAVAAGALSRGGAVVLAALLPYARAAGGTGGVVTGRLGAAGGPLALAVALVALRLDGAVVAAAAAGVVVLLGLACRRRLGGVTGDTLGATSELVELVVLVVACAL